MKYIFIHTVEVYILEHKNSHQTGYLIFFLYSSQIILLTVIYIILQLPGISIFIWSVVSSSF